MVMKRKILKPKQEVKKVIKKINVLNNEQIRSVYSALMENENTQLFIRTVKGQENYEAAMRLHEEIEYSEPKLKEADKEQEFVEDEDEEDLDD